MLVSTNFVCFRVLEFRYHVIYLATVTCALRENVCSLCPKMRDRGPIVLPAFWVVQAKRSAAAILARRPMHPIPPYQTKTHVSVGPTIDQRPTCCWAACRASCNLLSHDSSIRLRPSASCCFNADMSSWSPGTSDWGFVAVPGDRGVYSLGGIYGNTPCPSQPLDLCAGELSCRNGGWCLCRAY